MENQLFGLEDSQIFKRSETGRYRKYPSLRKNCVNEGCNKKHAKP